ncbi:MAG: hypothetical protein GY822_22530 [Deltaproteobacteria bacterium]|nr:hypothetical protein [Deltaproteobacteria bacterium]
MTFKILIADELAQAGVDAFEAADGFDVDVKTGLSPEEQHAIIGEYHGLVIRSSTTVDEALLEKASSLKIVIRAGVGVDNIDIPACTKKGVLVENTPFGNAMSAAEHAIALLCSMARFIPQANATMHDGKWQKKRFVGMQLTGKTLGVIGTGNVGAMTIERAQGLKMTAIAFDPFLTDERAKELNVEKVELDEIFARSDAISLHVPLLGSTRGLLGEEAFKKMKDGVLIINAARGGVVDEVALVKAIDAGKVRSAALDVFEVEPLPESSPLVGREEIILTPHLGASTKDAQLSVATDAASQMMAYLSSGELNFALNKVG